jgi:hypothetical protein
MKAKLVASKPGEANTGTQKMVAIQSGPYAGKSASLIGEFRKVTGKSIFQSKSPAAFDYMKRMVLEGFGPSDKVYLAKFQGEVDVAINENELKPKTEEKPKQENKTK